MEQHTHDDDRNPLPPASCAPGENARSAYRQGMNSIQTQQQSPIASDLAAIEEDGSQDFSQQGESVIGETSSDPARRAKADASRPLGG